MGLGLLQCTVLPLGYPIPHQVVGDRSLAIERLKEAAVEAYPDEENVITRAIEAFTNILDGKPIL